MIKLEIFKFYLKLTCNLSVYNACVLLRTSLKTHYIKKQNKKHHTQDSP